MKILFERKDLLYERAIVCSSLFNSSQQFWMRRFPMSIARNKTHAVFQKEYLELGVKKAV